MCSLLKTPTHFILCCRCLGKIICKGKVLYPIASSSSSSSIIAHVDSFLSEQQRQAQHEWNLSLQLLEWSQHNKSSNRLPALLVLGTPSQTRDLLLEQERQHRQQQQTILSNRNSGRNNNNSSYGLWTFVSTVTVRDVVTWGQRIVLGSVRWTWHAVWDGCHWMRTRVFGRGRETATGRREHVE